MSFFKKIGKIKNFEEFFEKLYWRFDRLLFFPIELIVKVLMFIVLIFLYYFDEFDKYKKWTIQYACVATK